MTRSPTLSKSAETHMRDITQQAKDAAQKTAQAQAEKVQGQAAHEVQQVADAAQAAAGSIDPASMQAQAVQHVASHLEGIADQIRATDINTTVRKVSDFARENPALFIGAAALAGFAATRFLKARAPESQYAEPTGDPWSAPADAPATTTPSARHPDQDTLAQLDRDADHHTKVTTSTGASNV